MKAMMVAILLEGLVPGSEGVIVTFLGGAFEKQGINLLLLAGYR